MERAVSPNPLHSRSRIWYSLVAIVALAAPTHGQSRDYPPKFESCLEETYKTVGDTKLKLWIFHPDKTNENRPAIIFFFGGGWKKGSPAQFEQHCRYFASRGMTAITADYRVLERHGTHAKQCVADAKSAIRYLRENSKRLGIDPNRIVAAGGSAGGHLAACTGILRKFDEPEENHSISSVPNAMALFNPALVIEPMGTVSLPADTVKDISSRMGTTLRELSPAHHIRADLPPTIIFHGTGDTSVPFATAQKYTELAKELGNRCELESYPGASHGFFNYGRGGTPGDAYLRTTQKLDQFLSSIGYLEGPPDLNIPTSKHVHLRSHFDNARYTFSKTKKGRVAFIGGSITAMNGYRPMVAAYLTEKFPDTEFEFINAGISSTCSTTGAFRLQRDVLSKNPDLFFIEFAVNDDQDAAHAPRECARGMEGVLRQAIRSNPKIDMVVTHFINPPMLELLRQGQSPISQRQHERVAAHYGVSTNDLASEVAERISNGSLSWQVYGGTHPKPAGNRIAADQIIDLLETAWKNPLPDNYQPIERRPARLLDNGSYTRGRFLAMDRIVTDPGWSKKVPEWKEIPGQCRAEFREATMLTSESVGASATIEFRGTAAGAYVLAGPDAGSIDYSIDGREFKTVDLYHRFSKGLHYPRTVMFETDLADGDHTLTLRVSKESHQDSKGHSVRILSLVAN